MKELMKVLSAAGVASYSAVACAQGQLQGYGMGPGVMGWGCGMG